VITAVDSNILVDVLNADQAFGARSREALRRCVGEGGLIACDVVWAEVTAAFETPEKAADAMRRFGVAFSPLQREAALLAGMGWRNYRRGGGRRHRVRSDFLIGAHARIEADRLLTRDRGFYRSYFADLEILDPSMT